MTKVVDKPKPKTQDAPAADPKSKGEVVVQLQKERLPYHPLIQERFGVDKAGWRVLVESIWPAAQTVESVVMALSYCRARQLDPFKRPVHIVPVYNSALRKIVETVWPSISELRTTAMRTGSYAGCDPCTFGEDVEETFFGEDKDHKEEQVKVTYPEWAQITLYRMLQGQRVPFPGPRVYWKETYATKSHFSELPNSMWQGRPRGQLEKCAEAAALRRAYPEELGNEYAAEEMAGRVVDTGGAPVVPTPERPRREDYMGKPAIEGEKVAPEKKSEPESHQPDGGERVAEPEQNQEQPTEQADDAPPQEFQDWLRDTYAELEKCETEAAVEELRGRILTDLGGMDDEAAAWKAACAERSAAIWKKARKK